MSVAAVIFAWLAVESRAARMELWPISM